MALKEKSSGVYIKLNLEGCFIDIHGTHAAFTAYKDEAEREKEKIRTSEFNIFMSKAQDEISKIHSQACVEFEGYRNSVSNISDEELMENLPQSIKNTLDYISILNTELDKISQLAFTSLDSELKDKSLPHKEFFEKLGLKDEWLNDPVLLRGTCLVPCSKSVSGKSITSKCMYDELKKVFRKEEYTDC